MRAVLFKDGNGIFSVGCQRPMMPPPVSAWFVDQLTDIIFIVDDENPILWHRRLFLSVPAHLSSLAPHEDSCRTRLGTDQLLTGICSLLFHINGCVVTDHHALSTGIR